MRTSGRPRPAASCGDALVVQRRDAQHDRVLDRGDVLHAEPDRCHRGGPGRDPVGDVGRGPDGFAWHDDQPGIEVGVVDADRVEPFVDLERYGFAPIVERAPARSIAELEPGPAEDERAVGVVLEVGLGIDPAGQPDVARRAARAGEGDALGDR